MVGGGPSCETGSAEHGEAGSAEHAEAEDDAGEEGEHDEHQAPAAMRPGTRGEHGLRRGSEHDERHGEHRRGRGGRLGVGLPTKHTRADSCPLMHWIRRFSCTCSASICNLRISVTISISIYLNFISNLMLAKKVKTTLQLL